MTVDVRAQAARVLARIIVDGNSLADALPEGLGPVTDSRQRALAAGTVIWHIALVFPARCHAGSVAAQTTEAA